MENKNYKILDNFGQEVNNFDMVVTASNEQGIQVSTIAMYWNTLLFIIPDFDNRDNKNSAVSLRKNTLWDSKIDRIVDRVAVEIGELPGVYKMRNIIKLNSLSEEMMDLRVTFLDKIERYCISNNVPRKTVSSLLDDARWAGYL